ncbi:MAG: HEAT repeat domain-containing protein [Planctomycetaceae bacterium]|nr:HEAT repeat domain-containing protein [Planctomycetales bacterium]MCB9922035.1 HEAT repeat domain-containing protein [Planctomycetaceae bacterium]
MRQLRPLLIAVLVYTANQQVLAVDANRLTFPGELCNPYYVHRDFPKLTTPQWVGEEGVEAVVVLAIDDMRDTAKYEAYLRPILTRLKQIDGRAPVSIMTCKVDPTDPRLQTWIEEGLSIECHTIDHPCPLLQGGDFDRAKSTYDRCVDLMNQIPRNKPVAFRMPCCDSLNTPSPRFWAEIFNKSTEQGNYLQIDSSVFNITTSKDQSLPRELVLDADGNERFRKYLPFKSFVNTIEDYPYPYIIGGACWEFPCIVPSDWEAQNIQQPNNPQTVDDMKAALDAVVIKQGTFNLVFHPHGWIRSDQIVELIDHAVAKHGRKVKFLTFREAIDRINEHLLQGQPLRNADGSRSDVSLVDLDRDGKLEVAQQSLVGVPQSMQHFVERLPQDFGFRGGDVKELVASGLRFVDVDEDGFDDIIFSNGERYSLHLWNNEVEAWTIKVIEGTRGKEGGTGPVIPMIVRPDGTDNGAWFHSRSMWVQNEDTNRLPDLVDRLSFDDMLKDYRKQQEEKGVLPGPKSPEASLEAIRVRPGRKVELVASEPLVADPVAFDWGPDGTLWVAEMGDYPNGATWNKQGDPIGEPGGRIRRLIDEDGDGKYERSTVFLDNVPFPNGVKAWRNGVLVSTVPEVIFAEDTDGDGIADKREVLFRGFNEGNQQHRANGLRWGIDNWLYMANGDSGGTIESLKTGQSVDIRGRDLRIRPDTGELETVSGQTQFGRNCDDWGNWFGGNNSNPMWHYVLDDHYQRRNPYYASPASHHHTSNQPGASPVFPTSRTLTRFNDFDKADRFTSACSPMIYRDELLFGHAQHEMTCHAFICEPVHNLVHREIVTPNGATFASQRAEDELESEFLASSDNWFRPTMVRTGPDGGLWLCDMYRLVIEHPEWIPAAWQNKLDLRSGHEMGRIYRVLPTDQSPRSFTRLDQLDTKSLVAALDSPNGWQRDTVQQLLLWRDDSSAIEPLQRLATDAERPATRLHAMCTLDGLGEVSQSLVAQLLKDDHPGVRRHAIRIAEKYINSSESVVEAIRALAENRDATVLLQAAYTLGQWNDPRSGGDLARLAMTNRDDSFIVAAALSSIRPDNISAAIDVVLPAAASQNLLVENLLSIAIGFGKPELLQHALRSIFTKSPTGYSSWQFATTTTVMHSLDRRKVDRAKLLDGRLSEQLRELLIAARRIAVDHAVPSTEREVCIELLGVSATSAEDLKFLAELLGSRNSSEIQAAAVRAMTARNLPETPDYLLTNWQSRLPTLRAQILDRLLARTQWTRALLAAIESKRVMASEVDARLRQQLLTHPDATIQQLAANLLGSVSETSRAKVLAEYMLVPQLAGDAGRGKMIFTKSCATCHRLQDIGKHVGPDLTALTDKSPAAILVAILDPNRAVEDKFRNYIALTNDGRQFTGMITNETGNSITLTGADAKEQTILRTDLEELLSTGKSLMPEGLEKELPPQAVADVIAYARSISAVPKHFTGNHPQVAPTRDDGSIRCFAMHARIYGPMLVYEEKHRNLGYWGNIEDHAVWALDVPEAGKYRVSIEYACDDRTSGNRWRLSVGQETLGGVVEGTGNWDNFRMFNVGEIDLPEGPSELVFRSDGNIRSHLLDLRSIRLSPL